MFYSLLFVAAVAFTGVLSEETIAHMFCAGSHYIGSRCIVPKAQLLDVAMLEVRLVNGTNYCVDGRYYLDVYYGYVVLVVLSGCRGIFDVVKIDPPSYNGGCGVNVGSDGLRIIGGNRVPACQYPWMVWINAGNYSCGGFIVDKDYVVTAANCLKEKDGEVVTADNVRLVSGSIHKIIGVLRGVKQVVIHPNYNETYLYNDIALLQLNESIKFDGCHSPVCIGDDINYVTADGNNCRMMGWGTTSEIFRTSHYWLRWANETIISDTECKKEFPFSYPEGSVVCGQASGTSFCTGDAGSPLVCLDGNKWFAYGIASAKLGRICIYHAGLYTHIPYYYNWIEQTIDST